MIRNSAAEIGYEVSVGGGLGRTPVIGTVIRDFLPEVDLLPYVEAVRIMVDGITVDGYQLADEPEALIWSSVNCFHAQIAHLDRAFDRITPEMRDVERAGRGSVVLGGVALTRPRRARSHRGLVLAHRSPLPEAKVWLLLAKCVFACWRVLAPAPPLYGRRHT